MEGNIADRYGAWPERLYIIIDGIVVYKGNVGPFGYKLPEVKEFLAQKFGLRGEITRKSVMTPTSGSCANGTCQK